MTKKVKEQETTELDADLLDELEEEFQTVIGKIYENAEDKDPRLELLVTFGLFAAMAALESGYSKKDFLLLMDELFDDQEQEMPIVEFDKSMAN